MFKNAYTNKIKKQEFYKKYDDNKKVTDESQIVQSSIVEMAKKYGIEAIQQKANETYLSNQAIQDKLYGHDLTKGFKSKEDMLNIKKKVSNLFNNIPAKIRKQEFNDDVVNFVNAYTTNDEKKLSQLNKLGIVSDTQLQKVKQYNLEKANELKEQQIKNRFINELNKMESNLYENFKTTGTIGINIPSNSTENI